MRRRKISSSKRLDDQCGGFPVSLLVWMFLGVLLGLMPIDIYRRGLDGLVYGSFQIDLGFRHEYSSFTGFCLLLCVYTVLDVARRLQVHRCRRCAVIWIGCAAGLIVALSGLAATLWGLREYGRNKIYGLGPAVRFTTSNLLDDNCLRECPGAAATITIAANERNRTMELYTEIPYLDTSSDHVASRVVIAAPDDLTFSTVRQLVEMSRAAGAEAVCVVDYMDEWFDLHLAELPPIVDDPEKQHPAPVCDSNQLSDVNRQIIIDEREDRLAIHVSPDASWYRLTSTLCSVPLVAPGYPYLDVELVAVPRVTLPPVRERRIFGLINPIRDRCD